MKLKYGLQTCENTCSHLGQRDWRWPRDGGPSIHAPLRVVEPVTCFWPARTAVVTGRTGPCVQDYAMVAHLLLEFPPGLSVEVSHVGEPQKPGSRQI